MREVKLSRGMVAFVSKEDYDMVCSDKWSATLNHNRGVQKWYAVRRKKKTDPASFPCRIYLHRLIMGMPKGKVVDHNPDPNGLICTRPNLKVVTEYQNTKHCRFKKKY